MTPVTPSAAPSRAAPATSAAASQTPARGGAGNNAAAPADAFADLLMALAAGGEGAALADPSAVAASPEAAATQAGAEAATEAASTMALTAEAPAWAAWMPAMPTMSQAADTASATSVLEPDAGGTAAVPGSTAHARPRAGADKGKAGGLETFAADVAPASSLPHGGPQAPSTFAAAVTGSSTQAVPQEALPAAAPQAQATPHAAAWIAAPASFASAMEAATGAVHQAAIPSHPLDAAFAGDIAAEVKLMAEGGLQQAELRLNPAELGPVRIQLTVHEGSADISFAAAHATTREGLSQSLPALRELLAGQGLQLGQAGVGAGPGGQGGNADPSAWAPSSPSTPGSGAAGGAPDPGTAAAAPAPQRRVRGLLDLYA